jgi:hypothetical protein
MKNHAAKLRGRHGAVLLATGALLGAIVAGPGGSIAASVLKFNQDTADKRYVKAGSVLTAGRVVETKDSLAPGSLFAPVAQTSIKAPTAGLLQITGTISANDLAGDTKEGRLQYRLRVNNTPLTQLPETFELSLGNIAAPTAVTRENGSVTGVFRVTAPGLQTISLEALEKGGGSILTGRSLSAVFVPKGKFPKSKKKKTTAAKPTTPTKPAP